MTYAVILFVFGFLMPNIDNYAHLGGFLGGYATARWLDPLTPERIDHLIARRPLHRTDGRLYPSLNPSATSDLIASGGTCLWLSASQTF